MLPGIDPKVDYAFKRLFGHEHSLALLSSLLDAVLQPTAEHRLVELTLLNPFNNKETVDDKISILDVKARDQSGQQLNIEMQLLAHGAFRQRALYYWARFHQAQLREGADFLLLRPTISICFVNTPLFPYVTDYHLVFELREQKHQIVFNDQLKLHILELSKFRKSASELASPLDRWLYFLCHGERLDSEALPSALDDPQIRQALGVLQTMYQTTPEREHYEARQKFLHDMATIMAEARIAKEEALKEGHKEGHKEGLKEGLLGRIHFCQRLLRRPLLGQDESQHLPLEKLQQLAEILESEALAASQDRYRMPTEDH